MKIGVLRLVAPLNGVRSLKEKRALLRPVIDGARHRFNAAVIEPSSQDSLRIAELGVVVASPDTCHCDRMLASVRVFIERKVSVASVHTEILDSHPERTLPSQLTGKWSDFQ